MLHSDCTITNEAILKRKIPSLILESNGKDLAEMLDQMSPKDLVEAVFVIDCANRKSKLFENAFQSHKTALTTEGKYLSYKRTYQAVLGMFQKKGEIERLFPYVYDLYSKVKKGIHEDFSIHGPPLQNPDPQE